MRAVKRDPLLRLVPVILLTARGDSDAIVHGLEAGADDYIVKPFSAQELRARINTGLRLSALHRELAATQDELNRKTRLATLGKLVGIVSHELRNPLGTIHASFYLIRNAFQKQDAIVDRTLERVERSIERCVTIIDELLAFARVRDMQLTEVDVDQWLAEEALIDFSSLEGITIRFDLQAAQRAVIDVERMGQAVVNVVANACQALQHGGDSTTARQGGTVTVSSRRRDDQLQIRVRDDGPGIEPEVLERVFEPLFSTKPFGAGLGLAHVREVLRQHGGDARVESTGATGTEVLLWIPISMAAGASERAVNQA